jgi:hypothetical protein
LIAEYVGRWNEPGLQLSLGSDKAERGGGTGNKRVEGLGKGGITVLSWEVKHCGGRTERQNDIRCKEGQPIDGRVSGWRKLMGSKIICFRTLEGEMRLKSSCSKVGYKPGAVPPL